MRPLGRLAVFGAYSDHDLYQRNRTLVETLEQLSEKSLRIRPRRDRAGEGFSDRRSRWRRLVSLCGDAISLWRQRKLLRDCDTIFVPYPAYLDLLILKLANALRGRRVIADAFLELHSTVVEDRRLVPARSLRARGLLWMQRYTLELADLVLIDTPQQAQLLRDRLAPGSRVEALPVGIDERQWRPLEPPVAAETITVLFWGTFIPLHGVEHIVAAARLLQSRAQPLQIRLLGDGQTAEGVARWLRENPASNLTWSREIVDTEALRAALGEAHIVLGVFGDSPKAGAVVPYKVHQALASNRPVITRDGPALRDLADDEAGLVLCEAANPEALARAIEHTAGRLRAGWLPDTRMLYEEHFSTATIRERAARLFEESVEAPVAAAESDH